MLDYITTDWGHTFLIFLEQDPRVAFEDLCTGYTNTLRIEQAGQEPLATISLQQQPWSPRTETYLAKLGIGARKFKDTLSLHN